jgi:hypothetical protein
MLPVVVPSARLAQPATGVALKLPAVVVAVPEAAIVNQVGAVALNV